MKKIAIIAILIILSACTANKMWTGPIPNSLPVSIPGPPEYQEGYKDGCQSGLATYGPAQYKAYYSFYQNYSMMNNAAYVAGWHESYDFCRWFDLKYHTAGEPGLLSADLLVKFIPRELGLASIYAEAFGEKTTIEERMQGGFQPDPKFSDNFKEGWNDGCNSGMTVYGSDNEKAIQSARGKGFVRDTTKIGDHEYETAWYDGINFCRESLTTHESNYEEDWWGITELK